MHLERNPIGFGAPVTKQILLPSQQNPSTSISFRKAINSSLEIFLSRSCKAFTSQGRNFLMKQKNAPMTNPWIYHRGDNDLSRYHPILRTTPHSQDRTFIESLSLNGDCRSTLLPLSFRLTVQE